MTITLDDLLGATATRIEERLAAVFDGLATPDGGLFHPPAPRPLVAEVRTLVLRGGKRLRAALVVNGALLFDEATAGAAAVTDAAAALELMQGYFIIHDDIMDGDRIRRGGPTVHVALAEATGSTRLGETLGILAGDLAMALAERLLARLPASPEATLAVSRIFSAMHLEVIHGQTLDLLGAADDETVATHKTGSYTTVGPLIVGATLAGASHEEIARLAGVARDLGVAFQLADDLLGIFGRPEVTGKPVGTDLRLGKKTRVIAEGLALTDAAGEAAIRAVFGHPEATPAALAAAVDALSASGVRDRCAERINELADRAGRVVAGAPWREDGRRLLGELTRFVVERQL